MIEDGDAARLVGALLKRLQATTTEDGVFLLAVEAAAPGAIQRLAAWMELRKVLGADAFAPVR